MTTVYIIRHGTTYGNAEGLFQGWIDTPLNEMGHKQAEFLGERFKDIQLDAVYASPLIRTRQTAEGLCKYKDLPIIECAGLIEINGGDLEGVAFEYIREHYKKEMEHMVNSPSKFAPPNGETMRQVYDRISKAIDDIAYKNDGGTVAVVSHGCAIQNYIHYTTKLPYDEMSGFVMSNAAVTKVLYNFKNNTITTEFFNDEGHIPGEFRSIPNRRPKQELTMTL
ncbi:MAG: histidine phosphatase family protein [Oscillospiraceae bacterium]